MNEKTEKEVRPIRHAKHILMDKIYKADELKEDLLTLHGSLRDSMPDEQNERLGRLFEQMVFRV